MTQIDSLLAPQSPWMEVVATLQKAGHKAFLVGGCVRDLLLGLKTKDADVATSARPEQVESLFPSTIPVGKAFGVIVVLIRNQPIEVATFRKDAAYEDGRHPSAVHFSDEIEDARRRDFTINALYLDPVAKTILDPVKGKPDLAARLIRAVGDPHERFQEDRLRILRAIRFQARLGFRIHPKTQSAIRSWAHDLEGISPERIRGELSRMLTESNPALAFRTLGELGPLDSVLPDVARLKAFPSTIRKGRATRFSDLLHQLQWVKPNQEVVAWSLVLAQSACHSSAQPLVELWTHSATRANEVLRAFNASKQLADDVSIVLKHLGTCLQCRRVDLASKKRMLLGPAAEATLETWRILALSQDHAWLESWQELIHLHSTLRASRPQLSDWITGHDLTDMGFAPGPVMGRILKALESQLLNETIHSKEEAVRFIHEHFSAHAERPMPSATDPETR